MKNTLIIASLVASLALAACSDQPPSASSRSASSALSQVFATIQESPVSIIKARENAKPGEEITLEGIVMGNKKPFVEGRAVFILGDPAKLTPCNENPDDNCKTPWDVCCETPEDIKASTVTIQVVDAQRKVLKEPIQNVNGLKPLSKVTVSGVVAESSNADLLILNARSIQIKE